MLISRTMTPTPTKQTCIQLSWHSFVKHVTRFAYCDRKLLQNVKYTLMCQRGIPKVLVVDITNTLVLI